MILSPKQKLYLSGTGFIIAIFLIFAFAVFPLIEKIKTGESEILKQKVRSDNLYKNWKNMGASKKIYRQIQGEMTSQTTFLPKNEALNFIEVTEEIAAKTNNRQEISTKNDVSGAKDETALKLQVSLYGKFPDLLKFIINMENASYFNDIHSLQISRLSSTKESGNPPGTINSVINLKAYYQE